MSDELRMNVAQAVHYLLEDFLCIGLLQPPPLPDIVKQVSTSAQLHDDDNVLLGLDRFINLDNMIMTELEEQVHFFHELLLLDLVGQALFVQRFQSHELPNQLMHGQVDLSEGSSAQHLADSVEGELSLGGVLDFVERGVHLLHYESDLLRTRRQPLKLILV